MSLTRKITYIGLVIAFFSFPSCTNRTRELKPEQVEIFWMKSSINLHKGFSGIPSLSLTIAVFNNTKDTFHWTLKDSTMDYFKSNFFLIMKDSVRNEYDTLPLANGRDANEISIIPYGLDSTTVSTIFLRTKTTEEFERLAFYTAKNAKLLLKENTNYIEVKKSDQYNVGYGAYVDLKLE